MDVYNCIKSIVTLISSYNLGRDLSPNSTPGLQNQQHPPLSATPPNQLMGGGLDILNESQRQPQWHQAMTANQSFLLGGPRMMNPGATLSEKMNMEEQLKQHGGGGQLTDMFSPHNTVDAFQVGLRGSGLNEHGGGNHPAGQLTLNQIHELTARGLVQGSGQLGHGAYVPAQSPPTLFQQQQMPQPMPPRPRPEGGQDPSPTFLNEQSDVNGGGSTGMNGSTALNEGGMKKDPADLIIGSWNDEETEKVQQQQQLGHMQQFQALPPSFGGGNTSGQQGQMGHMHQPGQQQQQQQAFMMHQQQLHNQRLIDEGIIQGMQGPGTGKSLHDNAANATAHGTPPNTGWGEPPTPSSHAPNNWGTANMGPHAGHPHNIPGGSGTPPNLHTGPIGGGQLGFPPNAINDGMGGPHKEGGWNNPNLYSAPPPSHIGPPHGGGSGPGGMHFEGHRGRGGNRGGGFGRGRPGDDREPYHHESHVSDGSMGHLSDRGGYGGRGRGSMGRGGRGGRGRGSYAGPPLDHTQEKTAGKKSAIAETIAMMK